MMNSYKSQPLDSAEELAKALHEQGLSPEEAAELAPELMLLKRWSAPVPTRAETEQLIEHLMPYIPAVSPVRRALRERRRSLWDDFAWMVELARIQVSILRPSFWLLSVLVALLGALLLVPRTTSHDALVLLALGPLWSYLSALSVFRSAELNVLELELACPPSPRQLMIARLAVVLGYDVLLGMGLSGLLFTQGEARLLTFTSYWLAPLFLVAGVTLLLSLRMPVTRAASIAYGGWLVILMMLWLYSESDLSATFTLERDLMLAAAGMACLALAVYRLGRATPRLLPHRQ